MRVEDVMTKDVVAVGPEATLKEVARLLAEHGISGLPVVDDDGRVVGVVSEEDVLYKERGAVERSAGLLGRLLADDAWARPKLDARTAQDAMSAPAITIEPWRRLSVAAAQMIGEHVKRLPVVDGEKLVGIVTRADLVKAFVRADDELEREIRSEILHMLLADPSGVAVTIADGDVTLAGEVETEADAEALPRVIERVPGVVSVKSQLTWSRR